MTDDRAVTEAAAHLERVALLRRVAADLASGDSAQEIADRLGRPLAEVQRMARQIRAGLDVEAVTPAEIINRYVAGEIDEEEMLDRLLAEPLTVGIYDPTSVGSGYVRGTWDDVQTAVGRGWLTDEQYESLAAAHHSIGWELPQQSESRPHE